MDIVKVFAETDETAEINIQGSFDNPLFQANQIGKLLNIKDIISTLRNFDDDEKGMLQIQTPGGMQKVTFLTELGLYRLLGMSKKPIAKKFNKWIALVIKEIRLTGQYKLEGELTNIKTQIETQKKEFELKKHNLFLEKCNKKSGVYFAKVQDLEDNMIIKIGSTEDILTRSKKLKNDFGEFIIIDFIEAHENKGFETFLHNYPYIKQYKYDKPVNKIISKELFLIKKDIYNEIRDIAYSNQSKFKDIDPSIYLEILNKQKEIEDFKFKNNINTDIKNIVKEELKHIKITETKNIIIKEKEYILPILEYKDRYNNRGNKIQKYTLDGKLVCTYQSNMDTIRKEPNTSVAGLKKAIHDKMLYKNYRWLFLDREKADDFIQDIGETKKGVRSCQQGSLIAMLDINKQFILKVYPDQLSAAEERHLARGSICSAIKRESLSSGHYFMYYDNCSEEMKRTYLSHSKLPDKLVRNNAKVINQLHPITKEIINTYNSMAIVQKEFQISLTTLKKAIDNNELLKNFKWSY